MAALARMPAPLPGLREPAQVEGVLRWACSLLDSPRQREADAGVLGEVGTKSPAVRCNQQRAAVPGGVRLMQVGWGLKSINAPAVKWTN